MKQATQNIQATITALERMTVPQLQAKYLEVFGEPSRSGNKDFLIKRIGWRIQSQAEGSLSERAKRRAEELARDAKPKGGKAFTAAPKGEGWVCSPEHYDDGGYTGATLDSPAMDRLLADVEARKIDCIVVYKIDRLSRSLRDFARLMQTLEKFG